MKSICLIVQSVYDFDPRVRRKAEALVTAGYSVDVLALAPAQGSKTYELNGVKVRTVGLGKKRGSLARYLFEYAAFFAWAFLRVSIQMRRRRYAIVEVNTLPDFLVFAPIMARWMGARIVLDMHEITPEFYMSKYGIARHSLAVRLLTYVEHASANFADRVVTINEPIRELLISRGLPPAKCSVVMNAADESRLRPPADPIQEPSSDGFAMIYHGTLTSIYGLDIAIKAFALVRDRMPGAELWILGSGTEGPALLGMTRSLGLESVVRFIGQVSPSEITGWLSKASAGILPLRRDVFLDYAFPNKLPELIVAGRPVLVSRLRAIRHYFSEEALVFFEPEDLSDLARAMHALYRNRTCHTAIVAAARREYAPIRWEVMKGRYLDLIASLAGTGSTAVSPLGAGEPQSIAH